MLALLDQGHRFRRGRTRVVVVLPVFGAPWLLAVAIGWGSGMAWDQGMAWGFAWWWPGPAPTSPGNAAICPSRPPSACAHGWTRRALNLGGPGGQAIRGLLPPGTGTAARGVPPASWPRLPRRPGLLHRGSPHSRGRRCGPGGRRCRCCCRPRAAQRWGWGRGAASPSGPTEPREMWTSRSPGPSSNRWGPNSWQQHNILGPLGGPFLAGPMPQGHMCRSLTGRGRGPQGLNSGPGKPEQHLGMDP